MNERWKAFLEHSAQVIPENPSAPLTDVACELWDLSESLGILAVTGTDALSFLQGQLTNDVRELSETHSHLSAHCTPKGRMTALFRVFRMGDTFYLQAPRGLIEGARERLQRFVLRARVQLDDVSDTLVTLGLGGDCLASELEPFFGQVPTRENACVRSEDRLCIRMPGNIPRVQILGPTDSMIPLWETLEKRARRTSPDRWFLLDIRAGLPNLFPETQEAFVPQMLNLQRIDGVSFTKGCYTGQEVVARMQYLGTLKRRMYWAEVETDTPPNPGTVLHSPSSRSEQATGWVVDGRRAEPGRCELLAVVEIQAAETGDVYLGQDGPQLRLQEPPYGFDAAPQSRSA